MLKSISKRDRTLYVLLIPCLLFFMKAVTVFAGEATLSWDPPTTNVDDTPLSDLAGYKIYYGTASGSYDTVIDVGIDLGDPATYQVTNLTDGIFYYFAVTAYDTSDNESDYSNEVSKLIQALVSYTLTVSGNGTGTGTVMSSPAGIDCGTGCSANYDEGTVVILTAVPDTGSAFDGWTGACSGTGDCTVTISSDISVAAQFTACIDVDNDGFAIEGGDCGPIDCDDANSAINPGADDSNCDGVDNDCNAIADDGYVTTPTTCGAGECASTGQIECIGGTEVDTCVPGIPGAEICDNLDNDCNGIADDGIASVPSTCGAGECASTGQIECIGGTEVDSCTPGIPGAEICDGLDNDCNGSVDDGIAATPTTCGVGVCASTGQIDCAGGTEVDSCTPGIPTEVPEVTCDDGLDNDCDGLADTAGDTDCSPVTYTITATAGSGGSISPSGAVIVDEGNDRTFTITPDTGYQILDVLVDGSSVGAVSIYTFYNVTVNHTIEAAFTCDISFTDVPPEHWAEDYINAIACSSITTGYGDDTYRPENTVKRAEMAAFIIRALYGEIFSYSSIPYFPDVADTHWAFKYIQRLYEEGITTGYGDGTYKPENTVNRAEMAMLIIRALYGETFSYSSIPYFPDVADTHWVFKYVQRLYEEGITTGYGDGTYRPTNTANRAQMAAFLTRAFLGIP